MLAGSCGGGQGKECVTFGTPASSGPFEVGEGDDRGLVTVRLEAWVLAAFPVAAGGTEGAHGGGVAAAPGGKVAAVAEHVRPAPESFKVLMGVAAEFETGSDQPSLVGARVGVGGGVPGVILAGRTPTGSVDLVAYLAR